MKLVKHCYWIVLFILLSVAHKTICIEPITLVASAVAAGTISSGYYLLKCKVKECCTEQWTNHNVMSLQGTIDAKVFGQHLAKEVVSSAVVRHLQNKNPQKALVMSFHGSTGSGKNFVSDIIARHIFRKGTASEYYHKKIATIHYPYKSDLNRYKQELKAFIQSSVKTCERSMFVFDEVDKMPAGLLDVLKPYLDFHSDIDGINYQKNVFIFLSNAYGDEINSETLYHYKAGEPRASISIKQMELIFSPWYYKLNVFQYLAESSINSMIDMFIPFLPMEKKHIKQCVESEMLRIGESNHKNKEEIIQKVVDEMQYFPKDQVFSKTGCKNIANKIFAFL